MSAAYMLVARPTTGSRTLFQVAWTDLRRPAIELRIPAMRFLRTSSYLHVSIATSLHQSFPWLHPVQA